LLVSEKFLGSRTQELFEEVLEILVGKADFKTLVFGADPEAAFDTFFEIHIKALLNVCGHLVHQESLKLLTVFFRKINRYSLVGFTDLTPLFNDPGDKCFDEVFVIEGFAQRLLYSLLIKQVGNFCLTAAMACLVASASSE